MRLIELRDHIDRLVAKQGNLEASVVEAVSGEPENVLLTAELMTIQSTECYLKPQGIKGEKWIMFGGS